MNWEFVFGMVIGAIIGGFAREIIKRMFRGIDYIWEKRKKPKKPPYVGIIRGANRRRKKV